MSTTVAEKDPDVAATYELDFEDALVDELARDTVYAVNAVVRPHRANGFYLVCTTAGRTSQHNPIAYPKASGGTLQDGSATFQAVHPSAATLPSISSATWTVPSGLTLDAQSETGLVASATLSGGSDGTDYDVTCRLVPSVGNPIDKTITVPVRAQ